MYNQVIEIDAPQEVLDFKAKVKEADVVLRVTPEYLCLVNAQKHLPYNMFAGGLNSPVFGGIKYILARFMRGFDIEVNLTDEATITFLDGVIANFRKWMQQFV